MIGIAARVKIIKFEKKKINLIKLKMLFSVLIKLKSCFRY